MDGHTLSGRFAVTLVTCDRQPQLHPSDQLLARELTRLDVSVRVASWSDAAVDWSLTPLTVLRSTWDTYTRPEEFQLWLRRVATHTSICNGEDALLWNVDKRYLLELSAQGVPVIASRYIEKGSTPALSCADVPWDSVVIKPAIGGGSHGVRKFDVRTQLPALHAHLEVLIETSGALLQRFEPGVETDLERSLVFIKGEYSHGVRRVPFNRGNTPDTSDYDHDASSEEIAFATEVLTAAGARHMPFARVDVVPSLPGILLMELELIDAALFFTRKPSAAAKLALVLLEHLRDTAADASA